MSQNEAILKHLKEGKSIEPLEALNLYGCFRLGARIHNLKIDGYNIISETVFDEKTNKRWAKYKMATASTATQTALF